MASTAAVHQKMVFLDVWKRNHAKIVDGWGNIEVQLKRDAYVNIRTIRSQRCQIEPSFTQQFIFILSPCFTFTFFMLRLVKLIRKNVNSCITFAITHVLYAQIGKPWHIEYIRAEKGLSQVWQRNTPQTWCIRVKVGSNHVDFRWTPKDIENLNTKQREKGHTICMWPHLSYMYYRYIPTSSQLLKIHNIRTVMAVSKLMIDLDSTWFKQPMKMNSLGIFDVLRMFNLGHTWKPCGLFIIYFTQKTLVTLGASNIKKMRSTCVHCHSWKESQCIRLSTDMLSFEIPFVVLKLWAAQKCSPQRDKCIPTFENS